MPEELWTEVRDTVQEAGIKTIPKKKKCKKAKRFCLKPNIQKKKKPNIQKTKIMSSGPITSWQIDEETMATVRDFILGGSKITADGDCSHEIKTVAPLKKIYDQSRQHIKKQRHHFANKCPSNQSCGFSRSRDICERWTIKKAEHWRSDVFKMWCRRRLLRVPWTARRSNQSILKEISPEYSFEELMLKLKLQYFGHPMRTDSFEK